VKRIKSYDKGTIVGQKGAPRLSKGGENNLVDTFTTSCLKKKNAHVLRPMTPRGKEKVQSKRESHPLANLDQVPKVSFQAILVRK